MGEFFVYSFFAGMIFFLLPVFVYTDVYVDFREDKAWFSLSLFKYIRIFGGYAQLTRDGVVIHLTKKKAIFFSFSHMANRRKKVNISEIFQMYKYHQVVETGGSQTLWGVMIAATLQSFGGALCAYFKTKHPFLSLKNGTLLAEQPCLKISAQVVFIFNGLVLTVAFIKIIVEVLINWIRKKRSTAFLKKQRSS